VNRVQLEIRALSVGQVLRASEALQVKSALERQEFLASQEHEVHPDLLVLRASPAPLDSLDLQDFPVDRVGTIQ